MKHARYSALIKPFFEEILLYSGQFGLFYILMQLIIEGAGFFSNPGHIGLLISLVAQAVILSAIQGRSIPARMLFSFVVPIVYSGIELLEGSASLLNAAHIGFWIYAGISSPLMVIKEQEREPYSRLAEIALVIVNIIIFIFIYFYFDTSIAVQQKELLTIHAIFRFMPEFLSDPTHWFIMWGGILLALTVALGRYDISKLKDRIYALFGTYVDRNVRDHIIKNGAMVSRRVKLCVLFSDIQDFTQLCENNDPDAITDMLNLYFEAWNSVVNTHHGIIDKYIGDAIMVIFGFEDQRNACNLAVACSLAMREQLTGLVDTLRKKGLPIPAGYGIGCHVGDTIVGDIGSRHRKNVTVIGDTVNIAARLESATRHTQSRILISSDVYQELEQQIQNHFTRVGMLDLKGKTEAIEAWGLAGAASDENDMNTE